MKTNKERIIVDLEPGTSGVDISTIAELIESMEGVFRVHVVAIRRNRPAQQHMRPHVKELHDRLRIAHFYVYEDVRVPDKMDGSADLHKPFGCIALGYDKEMHQMRMAISLCRDGDVFNKPKARDKARGRLLSSKLTDRHVFEGTQVSSDVMREIFVRHGVQFHRFQRRDVEARITHTWNQLVAKED